MNTYDDDSSIKFLPIYLKKDIAALEERLKTKSHLLDCLFCEVQGSINSAFYGNEITREQVSFLRSKYLGLDDESFEQDLAYEFWLRKQKPPVTEDKAN